MNNEIPSKFELIRYELGKTDAILIGDNLTGDISFMFAREITLHKTDADLKNIFYIKSKIVVADTAGSTLETESEMIMFLYKSGHKLTVSDLYGVFCFAIIANYGGMRQIIERKNILHNGEPYNPTLFIPDLKSTEDALIRELNFVYNEL